MDWEAIGAIGEVLGAVGVIVTLIYLSTQIRQNNKNLEETTASAVNESLLNLNGRISNDPEFADILLRGRWDLESLNEVETERFRAFVSDLVNLAVYVDSLQLKQRSRVMHYDMVQVVAGFYHEYPGMQQVIDSMEPITPNNLIQRFREMDEHEFVMYEKKDRRS